MQSVGQADGTCLDAKAGRQAQIISYDDKTLCITALSRDKTQFDQSPDYVDHVREASKRGLSLSDCQNKTGFTASQRVTPPTEVKHSAPASTPKTKHPFGMSLGPASDKANAGENGVAVTDVDPEGLAAQKGLRAGDVILDAGGKPVSKPDDVIKVQRDN